ncbi:MAG: hypothetical protein NW206_02185 [Hyphomonadaceae bacterium]|nr:hypothetical protein [Hyphomonadaceae bacterium]
MSAPEDILKLTRAGPIQEIARVGYAPFQGDDPIEIVFASGALFHVDIGFEGATDVCVGEGSLLEAAYGHLRREEPDTWKNIARDWSREALDLPWAIGETLTSPRRLIMTNPYRVDVGYAFRCGARELVLMGEADFIWATGLDDPELEGFGLEIGAAL